LGGNEAIGLTVSGDGLSGAKKGPGEVVQLQHHSSQSSTRVNKFLKSSILDKLKLKFTEIMLMHIVQMFYNKIHNQLPNN